MKLIKLSVVVLALVVCQVLSVPAPPSQPNPETVEKIKQAITRRAVAGDTAVPPTTTTTPDGDLQTDETFSIGVGYTGLGYPWGGGVGVGLGWGGWGYGGYGLGGYGGGYGLGGYGGYGYPGWGGYGLGGYGGYGLGYGLG